MKIHTDWNEYLSYTAERELDLKMTPTHAAMPTQHWPEEKVPPTE